MALRCCISSKEGRLPPVFESYPPYSKTTRITIEACIQRYITKDELLVSEAHTYAEHITSLRRLHCNASYRNVLSLACKNTNKLVLLQVQTYLNRALNDTEYESAACYRQDSDNGKEVLEYYLYEVCRALAEK